MLYSFPKQGRFLKRKTILYFFHNIVVINIMNLRTHFHEEHLPLAMATNMISLKNCPTVLLPTPTTFLITLVLVPRKASALDKAEIKWWSLDLLLEPSTTKILDLVTMSLRELDQRLTTHFQLKSNTLIKSRWEFLDLDNIPLLSLSIKMANISMQDTRTAASEILEEFLEGAKPLRTNFLGLEPTMLLPIKTFHQRENTVYQTLRTAWLVALEAQCEETSAWTVRPQVLETTEFQANLATMPQRNPSKTTTRKTWTKALKPNQVWLSDLIYFFILE